MRRGLGLSRTFGYQRYWRNPQSRSCMGKYPGQLSNWKHIWNDFRNLRYHFIWRDTLLKVVLAYAGWSLSLRKDRCTSRTPPQSSCVFIFYELRLGGCSEWMILAQLVEQEDAQCVGSGAEPPPYTPGPVSAYLRAFNEQPTYVYSLQHYNRNSQPLWQHVPSVMNLGIVAKSMLSKKPSN